MERFAVYAGSFDPPTVGHLWMIRQGAGLFDRLQVAVGVNPEKRSMFGVEERLQMLREITSELPNVTVSAFTNQFLVHYARSIGARFVLRGVRSTADFDSSGRCATSRDHAPEISTVFLIAGPRGRRGQLQLSVKGLIGPQGWEEIVRQYVAPPVFERIGAAMARRADPRFEKLWQDLGARGDPAQAFAELEARYAEPSRAYHTLQHVRDCLAALYSARALAADPAAVEAALWFHDAVYDARSRDSEDAAARR
jgi:pantetheine-phosphate adenylyltransferase